MQLRAALWQKRSSVWQIFWTAAALAVLALAPAIFRYGGRLVTRGDFIEQQIPFILETKRMLASGTPFWDWNTFLGENFFGAYAFYTLGSPFVWALMPLPEAVIPYGISVMAVLKHAVAATTAYLYLRRFVKEERWARVGALLYAFSGYSIINTQFYHFMDVVAVFPLLLVGLENAFSDRRRYGALAVACAINATVNYYFYMGSALFVAIYTACRFFSKDWREKRGFWQLVSVVFECGLGTLMAAWIMLPAGWAMMGISRIGRFMDLRVFEAYTWSNMLERLRAIIMPIESSVVHAFFGDASSWSSISAFLPLFGVALVLWGYLRHPRHWGWLQGLLALLVVISLWPFFNRMFVLGSNIFYTRWWYALVLMLCLPTIQALEALPQADAKARRRLNIALGLVLGLSLLLTLPFCLREGEGLLLRLVESGRPWLAWVGRALYANTQWDGYADGAFRVYALALAGFNLLGLWWVTRPRQIGKRRLLNGMLAAAIVLNYASFIFINDELVPAGGSVGVATGVDYYAEHTLLETRPTFTGTTYTSRVDAPPKLRNYGMLINQPSITSFHSLRSSYLQDFINYAGLGHAETADVVPPNTTNGALRSLLGVTTYYNYDEENFPGAPNGFKFARQEGTVSVYTNPYALPLGFAYTRCFNADVTKITPDNIATLMLNGAVDRHYKFDGLWAYIDEATPETKVKTWEQAALERQKMACYDVVMTPAGFTAKIDLEKDRVVCFTVQYDKGWQATVNGEPAKIWVMNYGMMAVVVPAGAANEIAFSFHVRGLREGIFVSLAAIAVGAGYVALMRRRARRQEASRGNG